MHSLKEQQQQSQKPVLSIALRNNNNQFKIDSGSGDCILHLLGAIPRPAPSLRLRQRVALLP